VFLLESNSLKTRNWVIWWGRFHHAKIEGRNGICTHRRNISQKISRGEILKVDTGCIVGFTKDVDYDIEFIGGIKNSILVAKVYFMHTSRSGTVYIQSLPFSRLADRIIASAPRAGGNSRDEGSLLGGLGSLLNGDRRF
jgi:hypothetical protein